MRGDCMRFPDTVEEFMEQYKVVDKEGIYMSKGAKLVPIFRMEQWFEHEKAQLSQEGTTKDTTSDLISRQAAIEVVSEACFELRGVFERCEDAINALPSAQKKGHWIDEGTNYSCSECHRGCWVNSKYCPWCGADMRGE